jgi:hypothetical protein
MSVRGITAAGRNSERKIWCQAPGHVVRGQGVKAPRYEGSATTLRLARHQFTSAPRTITFAIT